MAAAVIVLVVVAVVGGVMLNVYLRSWVREESREEAHMHDPHTPTVDYAVPNGVDPALVRGELLRAGFHTGMERVGSAECLRIECTPEQRDRVRAIIADVHMNSYDGSALKVGRVVFEDEH